MSLASMAAMLLMYLSPAAPLAMPSEFPSPDRNLPMERPSGGIVIEK
jgi:hypothetical protein